MKRESLISGKENALDLEESAAGGTQEGAVCSLLSSGDPIVVPRINWGQSYIRLVPYP